MTGASDQRQPRYATAEGKNDYTMTIDGSRTTALEPVHYRLCIARERVQELLRLNYADPLI